MFDWTTFLTTLMGSGLLSIGVVRGLSGHLADRWLARYKSELDKQLEAYRDTLEQRRRQIEAELGHRTYVTKTQFDTEFNAIKDSFAALGKLGWPSTVFVHSLIGRRKTSPKNSN